MYVPSLKVPCACRSFCSIKAKRKREFSIVHKRILTFRELTDMLFWAMEVKQICDKSIQWALNMYSTCLLIPPAYNMTCEWTSERVVVKATATNLFSTCSLTLSTRFYKQILDCARQVLRTVRMGKTDFYKRLMNKKSLGFHKYIRWCG